MNELIAAIKGDVSYPLMLYFSCKIKIPISERQFRCQVKFNYMDVFQYESRKQSLLNWYNKTEQEMYRISSFKNFCNTCILKQAFQKLI